MTVSDNEIKMSATKDSFEEAKFMKELIHLRDTQEAIQTLSAWCLKNKKSAYKIARCWLKCIKKGKFCFRDLSIIFSKYFTCIVILQMNWKRMFIDLFSAFSQSGAKTTLILPAKWRGTTFETERP